MEAFALTGALNYNSPPILLQWAVVSSSSSHCPSKGQPVLWSDLLSAYVSI